MTGTDSTGSRQSTTAHKFFLTIDGKSFDFFTRCTGLGLSVDLDEFDDGGFNESPIHLPKSIRYSNIVLARPVTQLTMDTCQWVQRAATNSERTTGQIRCLGSNDVEVAKWDLLNVMPVAWRGPVLDAESTHVPMEEIELAHEGFFPPDMT
ncbi:phage tail protein [Streptomyces sp. NPDC058579]|uniref:phage tail protein n=1 Tax=Streptomyces sp. NPDC058579 TaxID=3346548 RepID=UPI003651E27A